MVQHWKVFMVTSRLSTLRFKKQQNDAIQTAYKRTSIRWIPALILYQKFFILKKSFIRVAFTTSHSSEGWILLQTKIRLDFAQSRGVWVLFFVIIIILWVVMRRQAQGTIRNIQIGLVPDRLKGHKPLIKYDVYWGLKSSSAVGARSLDALVAAADFFFGSFSDWNVPFSGRSLPD